MPSISRRFMPLSITCVRPSVRGLPGRGGRSRNPSKPLIELLQSLLGTLLHVVKERVSVCVDADGEGAEVLDAELPQALRHQLLPGDLLDLLDLSRLERRCAADDREIDHPQPPHGLDRLVGKATLAADGANAVLLAEPFGEAHHPRRGRRTDADLLVLAGTELAHARCGVQEERALKIHRRLDPLVEDPHLRTVADANYVAVDEHLVAGAQLADGLFGRGKSQALRTHGRSPPLRLPLHVPSRGARPSTGS